MSIEQWGVLALVVLMAFLEGVSRRRRTRASNGEPRDRAARAPASGRQLQLPNANADDNPVRTVMPTVIPPLSLPPPLPQPASRPQRPLVRRKAVGHWLRPVGNLRRAIVAATILGRPTH